MVGTREIEHLETVAGLHRPIAVDVEKVVEELHVELVVLDDQDGLAGTTPGPEPTLGSHAGLLIGHRSDKPARMLLPICAPILQQKPRDTLQREP